ncbi:uncharacterized protein DS421_3g77830 [Arachis hypogaea]|nr:uncharacterized protein DS421_3g77830 [Arachis hypogaea]
MPLEFEMQLEETPELPYNVLKFHEVSQKKQEAPNKANQVAPSVELDRFWGLIQRCTVFSFIIRYPDDKDGEVAGSTAGGGAPAAVMAVKDSMAMG